MKAGVRTGSFACVAALAALAVLSAPASASERPGGAKKANCEYSYEQGQSLGTSYVNVLKVKRTSCRKGMKVVKAFNACRKDNGGADGRCKSRVLGFKCDEGKRTSSPAQYSATVVCKKGAKKVVFNYTQNT